MYNLGCPLRLISPRARLYYYNIFTDLKRRSVTFSTYDWLIIPPESEWVFFIKGVVGPEKGKEDNQNAPVHLPAEWLLSSQGAARRSRSLDRTVGGGPRPRILSVADAAMLVSFLARPLAPVSRLDFSVQSPPATVPVPFDLSSTYLTRYVRLPLTTFYKAGCTRCHKLRLVSYSYPRWAGYTHNTCLSTCYFHGHLELSILSVRICQATVPFPTYIIVHRLLIGR